VVSAVREVAWYQSTAGEPIPERATTLSQRELEVLRLLAQGTATRSMAHQLHLSPHTVRNHIRRITGKLGVSSRLEAIREGHRLGVL
jgi:DNA-binding CsgD family transcriptional regulator